MARNVRRFTKARKRQTKWCGDYATVSVKNTGTLAVADRVALCGQTVSDPNIADPLIGWCRGQISLSRKGVGEVNPVVIWAVVLGRTIPGTITAVQTFNPFDAADLERQDILGMGHCPIPPVDLTPSTDTAVINRASTVTEIHIKVGRRWHRNANQLMLWVVAGGAENDAYEANTSIRTLMKFG